MEIIKNNYKKLCKKKSDINEHLPTLFSYATKCDSVFETGVRGCVSSWAFTYGLLNNDNGKKKKIFFNDINVCNIDDLIFACDKLNIDVEYEWKNNLELVFKNNFDITFIDTWHVYGQLKRELKLFSKYTNKYIIMHDTTVDGEKGETIRCKLNAHKQSIESGYPIDEINKGLCPAIDEFLNENPEWYLLEKYVNNNGLTILAKK